MIRNFCRIAKALPIQHTYYIIRQNFPIQNNQSTRKSSGKMVVKWWLSLVCGYRVLTLPVTEVNCSESSYKTPLWRPSRLQAEGGNKGARRRPSFWAIPLRGRHRNTVCAPSDLEQDEVRSRANVTCSSPRFKRRVKLATPSLRISTLHHTRWSLP